MKEERYRQRYKLCWRVVLRATDSERTVFAETENISSDGFYCWADEPFSPGDLVDCDLFVPESIASRTDVVLHRKIRVLRLEMRGLDPGFGIACKFESTPSQANPEIDLWTIRA